DAERYKSDPYLKSRYFKDNDFDVVEAVTEVAKEENLSTAQVAIAWILSRPGITSPIIGVSKLTHLDEAIQAVEVKLNSDQIKRIDESYSCRPVIGHSYNQPDKMITVKK
ncbi:MAG: aldo/keto reductase, partial [Candidatus Kariarchaeaceae archaeon]